MRTWWTGALVGLVACGTPPPDRTEELPGDTARPVADGPLANTLSVRVSEDSVAFRLDVTNATAEPVVLEFGSSQRYDFAVESEAGAVEWRWSADRSFAQVLGADTLNAGETVTYEATWAHAGRTGVYEAVAWLVSGSHPVELRTEFELPE